MTIRTRLTLAVVGLVTVATGVLGWVVVGEAKRSMVDRLDERLADAAERPVRNVIRPGPGQLDAGDERSVAEVVVLADGTVAFSLPAGFGDSPDPLPVLPDPTGTAPADPAAAFEALVDLVAAGDVVVLSGAGLSTESGIPDYRGPSGASQRRHAPMTFQTFTGDPVARHRYWARSHLGWRQIADARANAGHRAVARLQAASG